MITHTLRPPLCDRALRPVRAPWLALALVAPFVGPLAGCDPPTAQAIVLPEGLALDALPEAQRALLRATLAVSDGALAETDATLDVAGGTLAGDFALQNVSAAGERTATLRVYGRFEADAAEVLLGAVSAPLTVTPAQETRLSFDGAAFETCAPGLDGQCALLFDENRNRRSNIIDLLPAAAGGLGVDPAPAPAFVEVSPSTLQFPSGIRLGAFARQVIVVENRGAHPLRVVRAEVIGGQGVGLSLFDAAGVAVQSPRRALDAAAFAAAAGTAGAGDDEGGAIVAPSSEVLVAVSFAPVSSFFTTGAVQVVVEDTVTLVRQTARAKVIANADGALRPASPDYDEPDLGDSIAVDEGAVPVSAFPAAQLFSGLAITGANTAQGGLARTGAVLVAEDAEGAPIAVAADAAFAVDVPAGHRFATSLGGLASDVDLGVFTFSLDPDPNGAGGALALACATCLSSNAGASPEAAELTNLGAQPLRLVVVIGRVDGGPIVSGVEGALVEAGPLVDFDLTAHVTRGPEFADDAPVAPAEGPLEGGVPVVLRGRGFDPRATVTFADNVALDVAVTTDDEGAATLTLTLPPGSLEVGKNPATIVVANPSVEDGGDGQAATLPEGFFFQPPAPRLTGVTPDFATTTGGGLPVALDGAFFSARHGAPVVTFGSGDDAIAVDATFESAARIFVVAPALPPDAQDAPRTVSLTVQNRLAPDADAPDVARLGAASNARQFRYVVPIGDAPTLDAIAPASGSSDGGASIVLTGTGFRAGVAVFVGGVPAEAGVPEDGGTRLVATAPARADAGTVDVAVVNTDGQSAGLAGAFTYVIPAPTVASVFPDRAIVDGDALLAISGTGFRQGVRVTFERGGEALPAAAVNRLSANTLLVQTPPASAGTSTVAVVNIDGQRATAAGFVFFAPEGPAPSVLALEPTRGGAGGGYLVTITGQDFVAPRVLFAGDLLPASALSFVDAAPGGLDRVSFTAPPAPGGVAAVVSVQIVNADQQSDGATFTYEVAAPASPRIDRIDPPQISGGAQASVRVFGANLADVVEVFAGGAPASFTVRSSVELDVLVPPAFPGVLQIAVATAGGDAASFPLVVTGAPALAGLSTSRVHAGVAGDQLALFGDNLDAGDLVVEVAGGALDAPVPANVLVATSSLLLVELPRLPAADDLRLRVSSGSVDGSAGGAGGVGGFGGAGGAESPPFSARAPGVTFAATADIAPDGTLTLTLLGADLNPARLTGVVLADISGGGRNVPCVLESAGETSVVCRTSIAAFPAQTYGIALSYAEVFGGITTPVDIFATTGGAVGAGVPVRVFVPDVGQLAECGDAFARPNEECDDGNLDDTDTCTTLCLRAACGDGFVQAGEGCDDGDGDDGNTCSNACVLASCGDGVVQAGEACDDGNAVNDDACTDACTAPTCGDSIAQIGEECDDGNSVNEDDCSADCVAAACGDGFLQPGEGCDDGNTTDGDVCEAGCVLASCGDGIVQLGEGCDDGNLIDDDECTSFCTLARCGDGVEQEGETCDDGNVDDSDGCTASCAPALCGDGALHVGIEECDDANEDDGDACTSSCVLGLCGDGINSADEACDDGNADETDTCTTACALAACGDAFVQAGEGCDDGNTNDNDACTNGCALASCGDGVAQAGEDCDDGNLVDDDACTSACTSPACGDTFLQAGEECDDGNPDENDACTSACASAVCGDGFIQAAAGAGEECDDANAVNEDECTNACTAARCGDGFAQGIEQCDDGNLEDGDDCTNDCATPRCGDGIVQAGEQCDDGNTVNNDACSNVCGSPPVLEVAPSTDQVFAPLLVGEVSSTISFTLTNTGGSTSGPVSVAVTGDDAADFALTSSGCGAPLAPLASCTVTLAFAPASGGEKRAALSFAASPGGTADVALSGTGLADARLEVAPALHDFGAVVVGQQASNSFLVTNIGDLPTGSITTVLGGANAADFAIVTNGCAASLAPAATCSVTLRFTPLTDGAAKIATLSLSATPGATTTATLTGVALAPAALTMAPASGNFGNVALGTSSLDLSFTVTNSGDTSTGALTTVLGGVNATQFIVTSNACQGVVLDAGLSCTIEVAFAPTTAGAKAATLTASASPGGSAAATLAGTGSAGANLQVSPAAHDHGAVALGALGATVSFTITNTGSSASGVLAASHAGTGASQFAILLDTCSGVTLAPSGTCTVGLRFAPTIQGLSTAELSITANPGGTAIAVNSGTGVAPAALVVSPTALDFGQHPIGVPSPPQTFVLFNVGGAASGAITVAINGSPDFQILGSDCGVLAGGTSCEIDVALVPSTSGPITASLQVSANPGGVTSSNLGGTGLGGATPVSCLELHGIDPTAPSGTYTIDPDGPGSIGPVSVHCDMTTDGGGYTFLKLAPGTIQDNDAELLCASFGMQLFIPRSQAHYSSAIQVALDPFTGPDGNSEYLQMLGVYPDFTGANCAFQPLNSANAGCAWSASDLGPYFIHNGSLSIAEPSGDNCTDCSMLYVYTAAGDLQSFSDQGHVTSNRVMCDVGDKTPGGGGGGGINVLSATYGGSCGVAPGNATFDVTQSCNGAPSCNYFITTSILGDPAPGCSKDFFVEYTCGGGPTETGFVPPEADGITVTLSCGGTPGANLLANGDFSSGLAGWVSAANPAGDLNTFVDDGAGHARMVTSSGPGARVLAQSFNVPLTVTSASLSLFAAFNPPGALTSPGLSVIQADAINNGLRIDIVDAGGNVFSNPVLVSLFAPTSGVGTLPSNLQLVVGNDAALLSFLQANPGLPVVLRIGQVESTFPFEVVLDDVVLAVETAP